MATRSGGRALALPANGIATVAAPLAADGWAAKFFIYALLGLLLFHPCLIQAAPQPVEAAAHVHRPLVQPDTRGAREHRQSARMRSCTPPGNASSMSQPRAVGLSCSAPAATWIGNQSSADT